MVAGFRAGTRLFAAFMLCALLTAGIAIAAPSGARAQESDASTPTATDSSSDASTDSSTDVTAAETAGAEFAVGDKVVVGDGPLNMRDKVGLDGTVLEVLQTGDALTITAGAQSANGYTWYEAQTDHQSAGWVAGDFLVASDGPIFAIGETVVVDDGPLNVRDDASINADVLTKLDTGATGEILDGPKVSGGYHWYEITYEGENSGWVAGEFLAATDDGSGSNGQFAVGDALRVATDGLNFRAEPGTNGEVLDTLDLNALFVVRDGPVDADGYTWYQVFNYYYGEGWVAGELMTLDPNGFPSDGGS
jgi:uncharacterized protein YgiM (DUF1202 family)